MPRWPRRAPACALAALVALGLVAGCGSSFGSPQATGEVTRDATADAVGVASLSLVTDNAAVTVESWPQAQVDAHVRLKATGTSDADVQQRLAATSLALRREGSALRVDVTMPPERVTAQEFTLRLPAALALDLRTSNGAISVSGVTGAVQLHTTNGAIDVRGTTGAMDLHSTNGAITLADVASRSTLETTNGSINVRLAAGAGADLDLETRNGSITAPGAAGGRQVKIAVGSGGPPVTARTTNGGITVTRGS
jgi:putative adhesin